MAEQAAAVVCVTGASGYIASWLVKLLLHRGYTVRATVRNLSDPQKVEHLLALEGAAERLKLFESDLLIQGSFDSVVHGCQAVFHTASPVALVASDPQKELIDPAVKGTMNVLESCKKASLKRVIITSSMASVMFNYNPLGPDVVVDESWYSDTAFCRDKKEWYALSKTLAETAAREFSEANGLDLITLHPGFVIGPLLQPTINLTSQSFADLISKGKEVWPSGVYRYVDVRDTALAHILAFENVTARGRYCLVNKVIRSSQALDMLTQIFPSLELATVDKKKNDGVGNGSLDDNLPPYKVSKERAESLGVCFTPLEVTFKDTVESLKEKGIIDF
ncbi:phenylacetaldehyde reductase-like [Andrographis paniculata]|uniref:phenylacetaldehyde reductase-like n=1 Tax=Andrographis paniculata TaxID=175694 RepID=UPI0021E93AE5|nr:phenylacetaldehyde reductase-like [Andrographis paniculata]